VSFEEEPLLTAMEEDAPSADLDDVLFEVFSNGQRHAIGAQDDPDDMELDEPLRLMVPIHLLQLLARDNQNRHWGRREADHEDEDDDDDEDEDEMLDQEDVDDEDHGSLEDEDSITGENAPMDEEAIEEQMPNNDVEMEDVSVQADI
jgi:hypothetical protein